MIEKCSIGNMSYNIQNITLIILILILIIVIIYYLRNSSTKHNELIEKYTTPTDIKSDESYNTHNSLDNSQRNNEFPTSGTEITLRACQVQFNDKFDGYPNDTVRYVYEDGWQEIATLKEPGLNSTFKDVPIKIISRSNETNQDAITNYSERSKCFRKMSDTDNKYRYAGNALINYRTGNNLTKGTHSQLNADGALENYMEMKFNLDPLKTSDYYNNLKTSICSLRYSNTLGGTSLGDKVLYRLTLNARYQITAINQITINSTNNHIFTVNLTTDLAALLTSSGRNISYQYNGTNFVYKDKLNNTGTQDNGKNNIDVEIYTFNRELLCNRENEEMVKYQTIKSYKIIDNNKIDVNTILTATSGDVEKIIENTNFPGTATDQSYSSKDSLLTAINERIKSEKDTANTSVNTNIEDYKTAITTKEGERNVFLTSINTKATFFDKIFDADTVEIRRNFLVSESGLISGLELNKLGYTTQDVSAYETILTTTQEPSFSKIVNNNEEDIYTIETYYNDDTLTLLSNKTDCEILVVGGGGGGGGRHAGGGGGGSVIYLTNQELVAGTYTIRVGTGGSGSNGQGHGNIGGDSSISLGSETKYLAKGGGGGYFWFNYTNGNGGSGGGGGEKVGSAVNTNIPSGTYGTSGCLATGGGSEHNWGGGGGGGASTTDKCTNSSGNVAQAGNGGNGIQISISGKATYYGGGGGGGTFDNPNNKAGNGGLGGGGNGSKGYANASHGLSNTGGGGGGGGFNGGHSSSGGNGGSGIVLRYRNVPVQDGNENEKQIKLTFDTNQFNKLVYDFSSYNDLTSWKNYATSIGATTNVNSFDSTHGVWFPNDPEGYLKLTLNNSSYNYIKVYFGCTYPYGSVVLRINNEVKETCLPNQFKTYSQSYNIGDVLTIAELNTSIIAKKLIITLENRIVNYTTTLPIQTTVNINGNAETLNAGTYEIIMDPSGSEIRNQATKASIGKYAYTDGNKLTFKYAMSKTLSQLHELNTTFSGTQYKNSIADEKYSLGTKEINKITKYRIYLYRKQGVNHIIQLYAGGKQLNNGTDYTTSGSYQEADVPTINLYNFYITINKTISGAIYLKSINNNPIFYIDETSRTTFNNTTDPQFETNVNNLIDSASTKLPTLNSMFGVTTAIADLATEEGKLITYDITRRPGSHAQITIDFKSNPVSRTSLNNLAIAYNTISGYSPQGSGGITPKLNANFGDILNSAPTDIDEYISYEFPSPPTDTQITPSNRANRFNIKSQATKYVYFKKKGGGQTPTSSVQTPTSSVQTPISSMQIPNSSPQRRRANETPFQNANSQSTGGNQASGLGDIKVFKANDTVSIPPGGWNCDILMIGGGGGANRGGGGAGACIVAIGQKLPAGRCVISVGNGGGEYTSGGDSSISVGGNTIYLAKGGGSSGDVNANGKDGGCGGGAGVLNGSTTNYDGGIAVATNIVNGIPSGPAATPTYAVFGNRGGHQRSTTGKSPSGYYAYPGGGGGIGSPGQDNIDSNPDAGRGGDGLNAATINGITYNFKQYFGVDGFNGNGYIGGGGGGDNGTAKNTGANGLTGSTKYSISYKSSHTDNLPDNTGSGGNGAFGAGSSGIVIIRVRT